MHEKQFELMPDHPEENKEIHKPLGSLKERFNRYLEDNNLSETEFMERCRNELERFEEQYRDNHRSSTEMFTATFPEGYEIRFRTPDKEKYLAVQEACRAQIDKDKFDKINNLQDKYRFQNTFAIEDDEQALDFLRDLKGAYLLGLVIDKEDLDWIDSTIETLIS